MANDLNILLVEDDKIIQKVLTEVLKNAGYSCVCASSCEEALSLVEEGKFSCALVDLGLPDGNGLDLLPEIRQRDAWLVPIILTGDGRPETIIQTMRAGAFDFLIKPFAATTVEAAIFRACEHHQIRRERDRLIQLLSDEREQLKQRVQEATADISQYAVYCETISARLRSLLRLTQVSTDFYTDDALFRSVFEELYKYVPIHCVHLMSANQQEHLAAFRDDAGHIQVVVSENNNRHATEDWNNAGNDDVLESLSREWLKRFTNVQVETKQVYQYPQHFWGRQVCIIQFFLDVDYTVDEACDEFLSMCAHFLAFEWQEARLFLHATQQASIGNIALELYKGFIQGLTAIRTTADFINETEVNEDATEGLRIIRNNVEDLRNQINEFRRLSLPRRDTVETVHIDRYIDQSVDMLSMTIKSRNINISKVYNTDCECVLLNGTSLARTLLDLLSSAVRVVSIDGSISVQLNDYDKSLLLLEIIHDVQDEESEETQSQQTYSDFMISHPRFILAQRTIQGLGGKLQIKQDKNEHFMYQILLPKNAMDTNPIPDVIL